MGYFKVFCNDTTTHLLDIIFSLVRFISIRGQEKRTNVSIINAIKHKRYDFIQIYDNV